MFRLSTLLASVSFFAGLASELHAAVVREADVIVYGDTASAVTAAVQTSRMGRSVLLVSPKKQLGGLTTGGLGATDSGQRHTVGAMAREFYQRIYKYYEDSSKWTREEREGYFPKHGISATLPYKIQWFFEPHVADKIIADMLTEAKVEVIREAFLDREKGVKKDGARITQITMLDGTVYVGKMFIDATYEGDLMAAAGVNYIVGRESNETHGETLNGMRLSSVGHLSKISPYLIDGDPSSGLLPRVRPLPDVPEGSGDTGVQAYNFRLCLTDVPENRVPFEKPASYDPLNYELLLRLIQSRPKTTLASKAFTLVPMPNLKTDTNNRGAFSTDYVGQNHAWPEASYVERAKMWQAHKDYQQGLFWFLANDPRVPEVVRLDAARWGLAKDEFLDTGHWSHALYVREARRMVSDYVVSQLDCSGQRNAPDGVTLGSYAMDSHHVNYFADAQGGLRIDGGCFATTIPYPISYRSIIPTRGQADNLLVSVAVSATHVAFGSLRMEPVFMNLGAAAGTAASLALKEGKALHDLPYPVLRAQLDADGHIFDHVAAKQALTEARAAYNKERRAAAPAAVSDASDTPVARLKKLGLLDDAAYWEKQSATGTAEYDGAKVAALIIKVAAHVSETDVDDTAAALAILREKKVIKSVDYWQDNAAPGKTCADSRVGQLLTAFDRFLD